MPLQPDCSQHPSQDVSGAVGSLYCTTVPSGTGVLIHPGIKPIVEAAHKSQICALELPLGILLFSIKKFCMRKKRQTRIFVTRTSLLMPPQLWQYAWCQVVPSKQPLHPQAGGRYVPVRSLQACTDGEHVPWAIAPRRHRPEAPCSLSTRGRRAVPG